MFAELRRLLLMSVAACLRLWRRDQADRHGGRSRGWSGRVCRRVATPCDVEHSHVEVYVGVSLVDENLQKTHNRDRRLVSGRQSRAVINGHGGDARAGCDDSAGDDRIRCTCVDSIRKLGYIERIWSVAVDKTLCRSAGIARGVDRQICVSPTRDPASVVSTLVTSSNSFLESGVIGTSRVCADGSYHCGRNVKARGWCAAAHIVAVPTRGAGVA